MRFIAMTRSPIALVDDSDLIIATIMPGGRVGLVEDAQFSTVQDDRIGPIPISTVRQTLTGVPDPQPDVAYVVPWRVQQAMRTLGYDTTDVYSPDGVVKRDGLILGSRRLVRFVD